MKREADEAMDERLASIGRRTAALRPRGGFDDRVMQAVKASRRASAVSGSTALRLAGRSMVTIVTGPSRSIRTVMFSPQSSVIR